MNDKKEEVKQETTQDKPEDTAKTEDGGESAEDMLTKAQREREAFAEETTRREKLLKQEKEFAARKVLGGETDAGQPEPKKEEESNVDYAKKALSGALNEKDGEGETA